MNQQRITFIFHDLRWNTQVVQNMEILHFCHRYIQLDAMGAGKVLCSFTPYIELISKIFNNMNAIVYCGILFEQDSDR